MFFLVGSFLSKEFCLPKHITIANSIPLIDVVQQIEGVNRKTLSTGTFENSENHNLNASTHLPSGVVKVQYNHKKSEIETAVSQRCTIR